MIIKTSEKEIEILEENVSEFVLDSLSTDTKESRTLDGKYEKIILSMIYNYSLTISNIRRKEKNDILTLLRNAYINLDSKITINSEILYELFYNEDYDDILLAPDEIIFEFDFNEITINQNSVYFDITIPLRYINYNI